MARVIGLTGGIATGKSTVAQLFAARGARLIDAGAIVHELQAPGKPMLAEIAASFGKQLASTEQQVDALFDELSASGSLRGREGCAREPQVSPQAPLRQGVAT